MLLAAASPPGSLQGLSWCQAVTARACEDRSKLWLVHLQSLQGSKKGKVRLWGQMGKGIPMRSEQTYSVSQ